MEIYNKLRHKHKEFIYNSYSIDESGFSFHFSIDDIDFRPTWKHNLSLDKIDLDYYSYLIFNLGMVELVSYWKCACPQKIIVRSGILDEFQKKWWKKLYRNGLGEFFYINGITPDDDFLVIECDKNQKPAFKPIDNLDGCLIPIGGGKDSVVTMELLGTHNNLCYMINPRKAAYDTALIAGFNKDSIIAVERKIDSELLRLNREGYLNGHTPFSAIVAFSSYIFAALTQKKYIPLSNESSANEGNILGAEINHQYSKSTEFERDFREYSQYSFSTFPEYFSLLRPWSEWEITKRFVSYDKYLGIFQSCNVGAKTNSWCGKCAKCLYVYIMLSAFLSDERLMEIFGLDMMDSTEFSNLFCGLVYENEDKPFECVGTREEITHALRTAYTRRKGAKKIPSLLKFFIENDSPVEYGNPDKYYDKNNYVPKKFIHLLENDYAR